MAPKVLIIEDEPALRQAVARGLAKVDGVTVDAAGTVDEAVASIDREAPAVIVSDIDLPGRSGVEILGELGKRALRVPVIFVSAYVKAFQSQIPRHANLEVYEKPLPLQQLRDIVARHIAATAPPVSEAPFQVADYVQLACMGQHSVLIAVDHNGKREGTVAIVKGELWAARDSKGDGEKAFARLAFLQPATVSCGVLRDNPGERTIHGSWEGLLMESARLFDEGLLEDHAYLEAPLEEAEPAEEPPPPPPDPDAEFQRRWEAGVEALLDKRYPEAVAAFVAARALRPGDKAVAANLKRLSELGHYNLEKETA